MARRQGAGRNVFRVPGRYDQAAGVGIGLDLLNHVRDLVDKAAVPLTPVPPLGPIDVAQVAVFLGKSFIIQNSLAELLHFFVIDCLKPWVLLTPKAKISHVRALVFRAGQPIFKGPFVPNVVFMFKQETDVGVPPQEPQKLALDQAERHPLGRQDREALAQVKAHLGSKEASGSRPGPVIFVIAFRHDLF